MSPEDPARVKPNPADFYAAVPDTLIVHPKMTDSAFRLYALMKSRAGERGWFYNSLSELAVMLGKSPNSRESIRTSVRLLVELNAIRVEASRQKNGDNGKAIYHILGWGGIDADVTETRKTMTNSSRTPLDIERVPSRNEEGDPLEKEDASLYPPHTLPDIAKCNTADAASVTKPSPTPLQGRNKNAQKNREFNPQLGDNTTDRFIRWVGIAKEFDTRDDVWEWLRVDWGTGWTYDVGQWDASDWLGALRRLIGGFDGVRAHKDGELRELIETAKRKPEGLEWLVEYVEDLKWATTPSDPLVASAAATETPADPWGTRAPSPVTGLSVGRAGLYVGGPVQW